jgi:hypothetical protein
MNSIQIISIIEEESDPAECPLNEFAQGSTNHHAQDSGDCLTSRGRSRESFITDAIIHHGCSVSVLRCTSHSSNLPSPVVHHVRPATPFTLSHTYFAIAVQLLTAAHTTA